MNFTKQSNIEPLKLTFLSDLLVFKLHPKMNKTDKLKLESTQLFSSKGIRFFLLEVFDVTKIWISRTHLPGEKSN